MRSEFTTSRGLKVLCCNLHKRTELHLLHFVEGLGCNYPFSLILRICWILPRMESHMDCFPMFGHHQESSSCRKIDRRCALRETKKKEEKKRRSSARRRCLALLKQRRHCCSCEVTVAPRRSMAGFGPSRVTLDLCRITRNFGLTSGT
ncbi:Uncharacterized protein Adt_11249 [Abeliophyllum distichum]|uniref:Uncharacterized protein n=1 Tax=Abeliophyllum distichum TaxID=126358 RepID=A0ABD1UMJ0_9LAMI